MAACPKRARQQPEGRQRNGPAVLHGRQRAQGFKAPERHRDVRGAEVKQPEGGGAREGERRAHLLAHRGPPPPHGGPKGEEAPWGGRGPRGTAQGQRKGRKRLPGMESAAMSQGAFRDVRRAACQGHHIAQHALERGSGLPDGHAGGPRTRASVRSSRG